MPWDCLSCGTEYTDDVLTCGNESCAQPQSKSAWTIHQNATRTFVLKSPQLEVSRGVDAEASPANGWALEDRELVEAEVARALTKKSVLELWQADQRPAPLDILFVRAFPASRQKTLKATVEPAQEDQREHDFPLQLTGYYERRLVCVYGEDPAGWEGVAFEHLELLDVSDSGEPGYVSNLELEALKRRKELDVEPVEAPDQGSVCVRLEGMFFETNKAFPLPAALEGIQLLGRLYDQHAGAEVLVVGHTDSSGSEATNRSLSLDRAAAVVAYLRDDVEAWYRHYTSNESETRRWGFPEDTHMLSVLPREGEGPPYFSEEHEDPSLLAAVKRYQSAKGLVVDGDPGKNTRRALIADYMALDKTTLPAETSVLGHGCGEHFPAHPTDDGADEPRNRRVELYLFDEGIQPRPAGETSQASSTEYPLWLESVSETRTLTPSAAGYGSFLVVTDIAQESAATSKQRFELRSTDGAYQRALTPSDGVVGPDGHIDLTFEDMPLGSHYTLEVTLEDEHRSVLFEDVPFARLSAKSDDLTETLPPYYGA